MPADPKSLNAVAATPRAAVTSSHDTCNGEDNASQQGGDLSPTLATPTMCVHAEERAIATHHHHHLSQLRAKLLTPAESRALPGDNMAILEAVAILLGLQATLLDGRRRPLCDALSDACRFAAAASLEWMALGERPQDLPILLDVNRIGFDSSGCLAFIRPCGTTSTRH